MEKIKLTYPSPHPGTHLLVETKPGAFSRWLERLPAGNMARYVSEIADAVSNLNRTELPISQRIDIVQRADIAYETIHDYYRPLMKSGPHKGKHAPPDELNELFRLTRELSFAYKIAVHAYIGKRKLFGKNKHLANAINMALHYLGLVLLEHYEIYAPIPMHIWREVHQLYYCAEERDLSELKLSQPSLRNCFEMVETTFLRNCLIAISNPYHLKRGDHWEVFAYLAHWTSLAIISEDPDDFSTKKCFVIDLDGDDKPVSLKSLNDHNNPKLRYILTQQLTIKLCHQIDGVQASNKSLEKCFSRNVVAQKASQLLNDMLSSWEMKQERLAPRYPKISKMEVIWGLPNIHKVISATDPLMPSEISEQEVEETHKLIEGHWNTVDDSSGGICISQSIEKISEIDVGLLVAIRKSINDENPESWSLGIICWITGNKRNGTQIGIQYIEGELQAVQLQARKGNRIDTRFQAALLVSGIKLEGLNTPTLLTSTGLYVESRPMLLRIGEEEQFIHARMKVTSSGTVDRFFYQHDNQEIAQPATNKSSTSKKGKSATNEEINLKAMPSSYVEDFDAASKKAADQVVTLDDVIVSKNK